MRQILRRQIVPEIYPRTDIARAGVLLNCALLAKDPRQRLATEAAFQKSEWFSDFDWHACLERRLTPPFVPDPAGCNTKYFDVQPSRHEVAEQAVDAIASHALPSTYDVPGTAFQSFHDVHHDYKFLSLPHVHTIDETIDAIAKTMEKGDLSIVPIVESRCATEEKRPCNNVPEDGNTVPTAENTSIESPGSNHVTTDKSMASTESSKPSATGSVSRAAMRRTSTTPMGQNQDTPERTTSREEALRRAASRVAELRDDADFLAALNRKVERLASPGEGSPTTERTHDGSVQPPPTPPASPASPSPAGE